MYQGDFFQTETQVADSPKSSRQSWDAARVEKVMLSLVEHFRKPEVAKVVNPAVLIKSGGEIAALYTSALSRLDRPDWAQKMFPPSPTDHSGFPAFVSDLNTRLAADGIEVKNAKRQIVVHPWNQLEVICAISDLYYEGQLTREDALAWLKDEGDKSFPPKGIFLSANQLDFYFGNRTGNSKSQNNSSDLDQLQNQLRSIQKYLEIDLSEVDCVRGLLFESFVGVTLACIYGANSVEPQRQLPLTYRDLDGNLHKSVRLDFFVHGQQEPNYEVKLRNDWENIITSVMAQSEAVKIAEHKIEVPKTTVVYRSRCGEMSAALSYNIRLDEEAEQMRLPSVALPILKLINYVKIEDLLEKIPDASLRSSVKNTLLVIDQLLKSSDAAFLKEATLALEQIRGHAIDISKNLEAFCLYYSNNSANGAKAELSKTQIRSLYGEKTVAWAKPLDIAERVALYQRQKSKNAENILRKILAEATGIECTDLSSDAIAKLRSLSSSKFSELALVVFAQTEARRRARLTNAGAGKNERDRRLIGRVEALNTRTNGALADRLEDISQKYSKKFADLKSKAFSELKPMGPGYDSGGNLNEFFKEHALKFARKYAQRSLKDVVEQSLDKFLKDSSLIRQFSIAAITMFCASAKICCTKVRQLGQQPELLSLALQSLKNCVEDSKKARLSILTNSTFAKISNYAGLSLRQSGSRLSPTERLQIKFLNYIGNAKMNALLEDALNLAIDFLEEVMDVSLPCATDFFLRLQYAFGEHGENFHPENLYRFCNNLEYHSRIIGLISRNSFMLEGLTLKNFKDGIQMCPKEIAEGALDLVIMQVQNTTYKKPPVSVDNMRSANKDNLSRIKSALIYNKILNTDDSTSLLNRILFARRMLQFETVMLAQWEDYMMLDLSNRLSKRLEDPKEQERLKSDPKTSELFCSEYDPTVRLLFDMLFRKLFQAEILLYSESTYADENAAWFLKENNPSDSLLTLDQNARNSLLLDLTNQNDLAFDALMAS